MIRRFSSLLLVIIAALGLVAVSPSSAAAAQSSATAAAPAARADKDDGWFNKGVDYTCAIGAGAVVSLVSDKCDKAGDKAEKKVKDAWQGVWDSTVGELIRAGRDAAKWGIKHTLTLAFDGPSLDLEKTGLFAEDATLAGMMVWLGWVIAAFGLMWQLGKMAVTGQMKYAGQALAGWVQNALITGAGFTVIALLLKLGDKIASGLLDNVFGDGGLAYETIVAVLVPTSLKNPALVISVVVVLLLVGFVQMVLIFLRISAIPIQCMLLPIAGAGRVGGETTRKWAPRLITSILMVIAYKPMLAVIVCVGFEEFGHAEGLTGWLRGVATLILGILAPGPLMRLFAPFGAEVGAGLSAGGALGAASAAASKIGGGNDGPDDGPPPSGGDPTPPSAPDHANYVNRTMPPQRDGSTQEPDGDERQGEAQQQATRNQRGPDAGRGGGDGLGGDGLGGGGGDGLGGGATTEAGGGAKTGAATKGGGAAAGTAGVVLAVYDGVNDAVQKGAGEMGDGGNQQ
ncbi:hypothetical protein ACFYMO_28245 [Streptomyces sp. NPDC007025]|uniref:hypothetical protein n=1 Tax=Streptomyces sp. NPDC007025 TaxID=3364771 RepID=UPI003699D6E3